MSAKTSGALVALAGANGFLAVALGAYAAHGLEAPDPAALAAFRTGASYHLAHALALLALGALAGAIGDRLAHWAGMAFLAGIVLFCGSLYFLGLTGSRALVLVTPLGGLSFLAGWLVVIYGGWKLWRESLHQP